jgi:tetratricopeptide (TPR) repeat protein
MENTTLREYLQNTEDAISSGRIDDAMANCQHILSYFPDALEAQRLLGEVYLSKGQLEEAQQTFDWILANDPENVIAYCDRALTSERMSDIDTALDCYQQAYELSRGNSQIRREFNQLSTKVGQQEFMFSRAGLARLYMRGDLLTQAIQEWEAVLSAGPERLDARTGLLETYWREGTYDKVEQLATRILREIPTCLKALLLLAHVTFTYNPEQSKELIKRAEALDPELVMAQELFSDLIASQPNDPFLASLKKEPIVFTDGSQEKQISKLQTAINTAVEANGSHRSLESSEQHQGWSNLESWRELDTMQVSRHVPETVQEDPAISSWSEIINDQHINSRVTVDQVSQSQKIEPEPEAWETSPAIDDDFNPAILEQQPWFQADQAKTSTAEPAMAGENLGNIASSESLLSWSTSTQAADLPSPPAWLDMLTKIDQQPGGSIPSSSSQLSSVQEPLKSSFLTQPQVETEFDSPQSRKKDSSIAPDSTFVQKTEPAFLPSEENDQDMRWPEWLKSLGAEVLEREPEPGTAPVTPEPQDPLAFQTWVDQIDQTLSETDEKQLETLEHLENDLHSQGFVTLQPGTLSTLAQEPSLSSALAQLGNFSEQPAAPGSPDVLVQPDTFAQPIDFSVPAGTIPPLTTPSGHMQLAKQEQQLGSAANQDSEMPASQVAEQPIKPDQGDLEPLAQQIFEPVANPVVDISRETPLIPAFRANALLENELETTMRRPAIRLQPMHQSVEHSDAASLMGRGLVAERGTGGKAQEEILSNKERLLRGYQFQLAGAYDDAMQEYRIIIRNAPEVLSEVISNLRALLRLTPKYSAGFRVLGDAYMRQGEYLQAMEAYNKALTIAKKARSQSN